MALVKQWITGFLKRHKVRFRPHDWPDDSEEMVEFVRLWITAFATREVTEAEADEASRSLGLTPPNFYREHIPAVVAKVEELRRQRGGGAGGGTREAAREASRGCVYCGGDGLATAWAEAPDSSKRIPATVAAFCSCPLGRWMKRTSLEKDPGVLRKILDFAAVIEGDLPGWTDWPPGLNRPGSQPRREAAPSRAQVNAMFRTPV